MAFVVIGQLVYAFRLGWLRGRERHRCMLDLALSCRADRVIHEIKYFLCIYLLSSVRAWASERRKQAKSRKVAMVRDASLSCWEIILSLTLLQASFSLTFVLSLLYISIHFFYIFSYS